MAVDEYYFDASIAGPTDPGGAWTDDANAFNGVDSTGADPTATGSKSSNYLEGKGTTAPTSGGVIAQNVEARFFQSTGGATNYSEIAPPSGGWTWDAVNKLEARAYATESTNRIFVEIYEEGDAGGTTLWVDNLFATGIKLSLIQLKVTSIDDQTGSPDGIASTLAFGDPVIGQIAEMEGIPSTLAFGILSSTGIATVSPDGIPSTLAFGDPFAHIPKNSATIYTRSSKPDTAYTKSSKPKTEHTRDSP